MSLIGLILFGVGGFALYMFLKSGKSQPRVDGAGGGSSLPVRSGAKALASPSGDKSPLHLALNDIVTHLDQDFMVEGKLTYREDGDEWWEFRLVDGSDEAYLCVEDDDKLEVSLWREIDLEIPASGPPESLVWEGDRYRCVEQGEASVTRDGKTGRKSGMACSYWDYEASGGKMLGVERWGKSYETWTGAELEEGRYDILPGDLIEG